MACNCKHNQEAIEEGYKLIKELRELFIKRMTLDSPHTDRRKKDYNQAIFLYESDKDVDRYNEFAKAQGWPTKEYGSTRPVWSEIDMDMVLNCFDNAVKDWRATFCDVENCHRKP